MKRLAMDLEEFGCDADAAVDCRLAAAAVTLQLKPLCNPGAEKSPETSWEMRHQSTWNKWTEQTMYEKTPTYH